MRFMIIVTSTAASEAGARPDRKLVAGCTLIRVRSREEALEWTPRFPAPFGDGDAAGRFRASTPGR